MALQNPTNPWNGRIKLDFLCKSGLQRMDPEQPVVDVGVVRLCDWFHAPDLLETQILSDKPPFPIGIHNVRGVRNFGRRNVFQFEDCLGSAHFDTWHLPGFDFVCMSDKV